MYCIQHLFIYFQVWVCMKGSIVGPEPYSHLFLVSNSSNVSQNALDLLLSCAFADVILEKATKRCPNGADVILTQIPLPVPTAG